MAAQKHPRIYFDNFKIADNAAGLAAASEIELAEDGGQLKIEPHLLEQVISGSLEPDKIFSLGNKISVKAWVTAETLAEMGIQMNVADAPGLTINASEAVQLSTHAVQFKVRIPYTAALGTIYDTWQATYMVATQTLDMSIKMGDKWYLPIELRSTKSTVLTVSQTVPI